MKEELTKFFKNKTVRIVALCILALGLLIAVWRVFFAGEKETATTVGYTPTEEEARLSALLSELEGVGETTVMITEKDGTPASAIVVFEGEDGILIRTRIMEAAARALGLRTGDILVYPARS